MLVKSAIVLAAGRGERLRPITDAMPKSLLIFQNTPVIENIILCLKRAGIENIIINHSYLGSKIRQYLGNGQKFGVNIEYIVEPPGALETGGAIARIMQRYKATLSGLFWVVNSDIVTDFDFKINSKIDVTKLLGHLILVAQQVNNLSLDFGLKENIITNVNKLYTFTGIALYNPCLFTDLKIGRYKIINILREFVNNELLTGECWPGFWHDIGTNHKIY